MQPACTVNHVIGMHLLLITSHGLPTLSSNHQIPITAPIITATSTSIEMSFFQVQPAVTVAEEGNSSVGRQFVLWVFDISNTWSSEGNCYMHINKIYIFIFSSNRLSTNRFT